MSIRPQLIRLLFERSVIDLSSIGRWRDNDRRAKNGALAMRYPASRESGFTLLEVLVTLVVLGLLMVTLTQGTRVGLRAWAMDGNVAQRVNGLETTDRALRQLIERALPQDMRSNDGGLVGDAHTVSFTTTLPEG